MEVVFGFVFFLANLDFRPDAVLFVLEINLTNELVMHRAEERVTENVILIIVYDGGAVWELYYFVTTDFEIYGIEVGLDREGRVT